jgi:hypothetical protein
MVYYVALFIVKLNIDLTNVFFKLKIGLYKYKVIRVIKERI